MVAKNAVGSSWRKTVAARTYARLPDAERGAVRARALELLFAEPSPRVAAQLSLLVTNIARCAAGAWPRLPTGCTPAAHTHLSNSLVKQCLIHACN